MRVLALILVVAAAAVHAEETVDEVSLVEAGVSLPDEFTICLSDRPMMCLSPSQDFKQDGSTLMMSDRLRTIGQKFKMDGGVLTFLDDTSRVIAAEHGAQRDMDSVAGGRAWIWKKQDLNFDQQWSVNTEGQSGTICMRAFPKACLYSAYPTENKVIIANSDRVRTLWTVRPVRPCAANPCENGQCTEQPDGGAKCACNPGYTLNVADNRCFELDVCAHADTNPCDQNAACVKTGPGKSSCTCNKGWSGKGGKGECSPVDACKANPCDKNSLCTSTGPNLFKCSCKPGFVPTGPNTCEELDLCATANPCHKSATCKKTGPGQVSCQCNPGFSGNGQSCEAIDGCAGNPCGEFASCERRPLGGRQCKCDTGYAPAKNSKDFKCVAVNPCDAKNPRHCKGRNTECRYVSPGQAKCLCKAGHLAFWNGNCEKPGSSEALAAAAEEGSESARQELQAQKYKAKAAEERRKEMEREFRRKQKEREESIRALERRIRELIREKTNARVTDRDKRITALNDHIASLTTAQSEASKTAAAQLALIKALEKSESQKVKRLTAAMDAATSKIADAARAYAQRIRRTTEEEVSAKTGMSTDDSASPSAVPMPTPMAPPKSSLPARKPASPPQYHNAHSSQPLKLPINHRITRRRHSPSPAPTPKPVKGMSDSSKKPTADQGTNTIRFQQLHSESEAAVTAEATTEATTQATAQVNAESESEAVAAVMKSDMSADLKNLMTVSDAEMAQSDEDLENELAKLHAEVDSHIDEVLSEANTEEDAEEEEEADE